MLVHQLLEAPARRAPDADALIETNRRTSYAGLDAATRRFGGLLADAGVRPGDRVLIALDNSLEMVAAYLGAMSVGGVAVPLPGGRQTNRLPFAVSDCRPKAAVVDASTALSPHLAQALSGVPAVFVKSGPRRPEPSLPAGFRDLAASLAAAPEPPAVAVAERDLAAIIYTSGSTGHPRGVMLSHRNIVTNTRSIVEYLELTSRDRVMCVLPFYYVYGLSLLHTHLLVGGSIVLDTRLMYPDVVLQAMRDLEVTGFAGVPSTFALLLHRSSLRTMTFPALRYVTQAGGAMPQALISEWLADGPPAPFFVMYGATEASARLTYLTPADLRRKPGSIGKPISGVRITVVTEEGVAAKPGETGELIASGPNISAGYWNDPEATAERFSDAGYHTGDLGFTDEEGYLYLVGRRDDMLKVGAHRVGAKEIEDVVQAHPTVHEAAVVGAPHELLGEVPVAFVSARQGMRPDSEDIRAFCRSQLPAHKVPARVEVLSDLPKSSGAGKIDRVRLRAQAAAAAGGGGDAAVGERISRNRA